MPLKDFDAGPQKISHGFVVSVSFTSVRNEFAGAHPRLRPRHEFKSEHVWGANREVLLSQLAKEASVIEGTRGGRASHSSWIGKLAIVWTRNGQRLDNAIGALEAKDANSLLRPREPVLPGEDGQSGRRNFAGLHDKVDSVV